MSTNTNGTNSASGASYMKPGKADSGSLARIGPNTKGTGTRGVPTSIAESRRDRVVAPVEDPENSKPSGSPKGLKNLRDLGKRKIIGSNPATRP